VTLISIYLRTPKGQLSDQLVSPKHYSTSSLHPCPPAERSVLFSLQFYFQAIFGRHKIMANDKKNWSLSEGPQFPSNFASTPSPRLTPELLTTPALETDNPTTAPWLTSLGQGHRYFGAGNLQIERTTQHLFVQYKIN
jgi:hypothetical protein